MLRYQVKSGCADLQMLQQVKCGYTLRILNADVWVKSGCDFMTFTLKVSCLFVVCVL